MENYRAFAEGAYPFCACLYLEYATAGTNAPARQYGVGKGIERGIPCAEEKDCCHP